MALLESLEKTVEKKQSQQVEWTDQWQSVKTEDSKEYYYNTLSMETAWAVTNPFEQGSEEEKAAKLKTYQETISKLPPLWTICFKADGEQFFLHTVTKRSQIEPPTLLDDKKSGAKRKNTEVRENFLFFPLSLYFYSRRKESINYILCFPIFLLF